MKLWLKCWNIVKYFKNRLPYFITSSCHSRTEHIWFKYYWGNDPEAKIHKIGITAQKGCFRIFSFILFWPILMLFFCLYTVIVYGKTLKRNEAISLSKQFFECYLIVLKYNFSPIFYYKFEFWKVTNIPLLSQFIQPFECHALQCFLNKKLDLNFLELKGEFHNFLIKNHLPSAIIVARAKKQQIFFEINQELMNQDLFIKYENLLCGWGAQKWTFKKNTTTWSSGTQEFTLAEMIAHIKNRSENSPIIVQQVIKNHTSLISLAPGALSTFRVVTIKSNDRSVNVLHTAYRLPVDNDVVDNFESGGIACAVTKQGILQPGVSKKNGFNLIDIHPISMSQITGFKIPYFEESIKLAELAHDTAKYPSTIGWDIAITDNGPLLLEANCYWCGQVIQMPTMKPLINSTTSPLYKQLLSNVSN